MKALPAKAQGGGGGDQDRDRDLTALGPVPAAIAGDYSLPTVPPNIQSTDLRLAPDCEPGYETHAAELRTDRGSASGAHPADESPGFSTRALSFLSKTLWRS